MATKTALGMVYDQATRKVFVMHEYGLLDITRLFEDFTVEINDNNVHCTINGSILANINPDQE